MSRIRKLPPLEVLQEWFYEEPAGVLRWRKDYCQGAKHIDAKADEVAGRRQSAGARPRSTNSAPGVYSRCPDVGNARTLASGASELRTCARTLSTNQGQLLLQQRCESARLITNRYQGLAIRVANN